jgi:hypothetical protein
MTTNYDEPHWWKAPTDESALNWLYSGDQPLGLMHKMRAHRHFKNEALDGAYAVSVWIPREVLITNLPADLTMDEAKDAAKVLIVLRLKEMGLI